MRLHCIGLYPAPGRKQSRDGCSDTLADQEDIQSKADGAVLGCQTAKEETGQQPTIIYTI